MTLSWIADPTDPRIKAARNRLCGICKARRGCDCTNTIRPGSPLPGRVVHIERATRPDVDREPVEKDGS